MFKESIVTLLFFMLFAFAAHSQEKCSVYSEPSLGVSFCTPSKWSIIKDENETYAEIFGEDRDGLTPNINVQAGNYPGALSAAVDSGIAAVLKTKGRAGITKIELQSKSEFAAAHQGFKVVYGIAVGSINIKSIQYYFNGKGNTKIVVTATLPMADSEDLESLVDKALKTFKVAK